MENEDLSYKIRALLDTPDQSEPDWDPDKFWNLYEARKRRRQRWVTLSYSMAAMVIFGLTYVFFSGNSNKRSMEITAVVSDIHQGKEAPNLPRREVERSLTSDAGVVVQSLTYEKHRKDKVAHSIMSNPRSGRKFKRNRSDVARQPASLSVDKGYGNDRVIDQSIAQIEENYKIPSLLRMFEQARREREQRNLNVQLEDTANYNRFWLTVNQHLLANKLNSDHLHYERY